MNASLTPAEADALMELLEHRAVKSIDRPSTHELREAIRKIRAIAITLDPFPDTRSLPGRTSASHYITPGVLAAHLDTSGRTLRRLADTYSQIYHELPRSSPKSRSRLFPLAAVVRITAAHQIMRDVPGTSAIDAFTALRDGMSLPRRLKGSLESGSLVPALAELETLQAENGVLQSRVQGLQAEVATLQAFLWDLLGQQVPPLPSKRMDSTQAVQTVSTRSASPGASAISGWSAGLQPNPARLLTHLEAGYILQEIRGEVVLLTPSGQQISVFDPRMIASLVKQGRLVRDGNGYRATFP